MERFVIIVNDWKPLTIITKRSILDVAAVLDPPLLVCDLEPYEYFWMDICRSLCDSFNFVNEICE